MKTKIRDYVLREGTYQGRARLYADYSKKLVDQEGFEDFNDLLKEIRKHYETDKKDSEFDRLTLCFLNSTFWDYSYYTDSRGKISEQILRDMCEHTFTEASLTNNLERMSNTFKGNENSFYEEKVIMYQQLCSMVVFFKRDQFPHLWELIPLLLLRELENNGRKLLLFSTKEPESQPIRREEKSQEEITETVRSELTYLDQEYQSGRILSKTEYRELEEEVTYIIQRGRQPEKIRPLQLSSRGTLKSGSSYKYVTYCVSRIYWKFAESGISRRIWIEYLSQKIGKDQRLLSKKFTDCPEGWQEKVHGEIGDNR